MIFFFLGALFCNSSRQLQVEEAWRVGIFDRVAKAKYALERMGVTVFAGAVTTCGSALFMLLGNLTFFTKMGTLIGMIEVLMKNCRTNGP